MKKFLSNITLFLLPIILSAYFIDTEISKYLRKSNSFAYGEYSTWNDLIDGTVNSDLVIYGSSRAWVNIDPTMITDSLKISAYNLGIDGHSFTLQHLRHSLLLRHNTKPKLIVYSLDLFTFYKRDDLYNLEQFLPYMLFNKQIKDATKSFKGFDWADYNLPLFRYYGKPDALTTAMDMYAKPQTNKIVRIKGFAGQERSWNNDFDKAKKEMKAYVAGVDTSYLNQFEQFLQECKTDRIKIIFIYAPEYIEGQKFVSNRSDIVGIYSRLGKKYDIPFYDFSNDSMSFQKQYYYNTLHLNKAGAKLFTANLINQIKASNLLPMH